ncbi:MAG: DUF2975 domain-containing protein [Prevotellaceae bacterium]|jgi:hypothetical protein|nr:DUF2975 domain-containing protein [Prevotellaceae bacterium]
MNGKLKIYCACLAIMYVIFFVHNVYEGAKFAIAGFEIGYTQGKSGNDNFNVCVSYMTPVDGSATFPSTVINEKTGEEVRFEIRQMIALVSKSPENIPAYVKIMYITASIFGFIIFALFVYIPFIGYKIMKSITQNAFYSIRNIKKIRKISLILLLIFTINLLVNFSATISVNAYLLIKGYRAYVNDFNYSLFFTGLVLLILSEILLYTKSIKEEQDLTV